MSTKSTILPWHREAAEMSGVETTDCEYLTVDKLAAIIAAHDPHEPPLFTSRVLVPRLQAEIVARKAQHAETVRLLERAIRHVNAYSDAVGLANEIRAHLAALKGTQ